MSCFGCLNAKHVDPNMPQSQADEAITTSKHIPLDHADDPVAALDFEYSIPMLLMPFLRFKEQGRIFKSTKTWRDEAIEKGWLVVHVKDASDRPAPGRVVIFISHTWWDREFLDPNRDPTDPYDKGAPDYQSGARKDLKWRLICEGVGELVKEKGLKEDTIDLWIDWQSVSQARLQCPHARSPLSHRPSVSSGGIRGVAGRPRREAQGRAQPDPVRDAVRLHARAD